MMDRFLDSIDKINERVGQIAKWLVVILTGVLVYDVFLRYIFNAPTIWAFDIGYMLGGSFFTLGMGYTLLHNAHVRIDIFYSKFSPKKQAIIDIILSLIVFFPAFGLLFFQLIPYVYRSWAEGERSLESFWRPPIYPFKTVLLISVAFLLLQGVGVFIKNLRIILGRKAT
jgi:TRAP-type mannitol/chloroaromatic compound transport system permease small subunit